MDVCEETGGEGAMLAGEKDARWGGGGGEEEVEGEGTGREGNSCGGKLLR